MLECLHSVYESQHFDFFYIMQLYIYIYIFIGETDYSKTRSKKSKRVLLTGLFLDAFYYVRSRLEDQAETLIVKFSCHCIQRQIDDENWDSLDIS